MQFGVAAAVLAMAAALAQLSPPALAATLEIDGKLLQATPAPSPERVAPYPRALCTYLYKVSKVHAGTYPDERILVVKWAVWNKLKLPGLPTRIGARERLKLERWLDRPEFERERIVDTIGERDLVIYYDASSQPASAGGVGEAPPEELASGVVRGDSPGWLFLADELRQADTGRFWEKDWKNVSRSGVDPMPAMVDFGRRLAALDLKLLIVPVPMKLGVYPDRWGKGAQVESLADFVQRLQHAGLRVLDLEPVFARHRKDPANRPLYLAQDSHWSPEGCRVAAQEISRVIQGRATRADAVPPGALLTGQSMEIRGDLARMAGGPNVPRERLTLDRVSDGKDRAAGDWSDPASPIILLGDSHVSVFSEGSEELHGSGGGLADYLYLLFGYRMDVVASHGDGVHQARVNLYRRGTSKGEEDKARGYWQNKKWVVWVFAAREFTRAERWSSKVPVN